MLRKAAHVVHHSLLKLSESTTVLSEGHTTKKDNKIQSQEVKQEEILQEELLVMVFT